MAIDVTIPIPEPTVTKKDPVINQENVYFVDSKQTDFDPKKAVTVVEDINNLLLKEDITDPELITEMKNILPNFTDEMSKEFLKGNSLKRIEMMNVVAQKHQDKVLLDNKLNYMTSLLPEGNTVENKGFTKSDFLLQDSMSRSKLFTTRKKKFEEEYPNGVYTLMSLPVYNNETVEIFKKNKDDPNWNFRLPYGRDEGEFGVVSGNVATLRTLTDIAAGALLPGGGFKALAGLVGADYMGQQLDKTQQQISGYGEREYAGEFGTGTLANYWNNIFSSDMKEAGIVGGMGIGINRGINWFTKSDRSLFGLFGTSDKAKDYMSAFEKLRNQGYNIDPLVYAQIAGWPIIRSTFFQAKEFVSGPKKVLDQQALSLYDNFKKFGVQLGGDVTEVSSKINHSQLVQIKQQFELEMGNLLKAPLNDVEANAVNSRFVNLFKKWDETATAGESILKIGANGMSKNLGINYNLSPIKTEAKKIIKELNVYGKRKTPTKSEVRRAADEGLTIPKTVKLDQPASTELIKLLDNVGKLQTNIFRAGGGSKAWSEATDQIFALRKKALELTTHSDKNVRNASIRLYNKIKKQYSNPQGGTEEFNQAWSSYIKTVDANDLIRQTKSMKEALRNPDNSLDASDFVSTYLRPDMPDTTSLIMKMVSQEQGDNIKNALIHSLTADPSSFSKNFNSWMTKNPQALKDILGEGTVKQLNSLRVLTDKFDTGLISKALKESDDFSAEAFTNFIVRNATKNNLNAEKSVLNIIEDLGGFNSQAVDEIRSGIIANILKNSKDTSGKSADILGDTLDASKFYKEVGKLLDENSPLSKFFDKEHLAVIKDFDLYTQAITNAGDVGGPMAAGSVRGQIAALPTQPTNIVKVAKHILGYKFISLILGKKQNAATFQDLKGNFFTEEGISALKNMTASQLGDLVSEGSFGIDDPNTGSVIDFVDSVEKKVIESEVNSLPGSDSQQIKDERGTPGYSPNIGNKIKEALTIGSNSNVPSRLNQTNMAPPIGAGAGPKVNTMAGGPSTMNRGQQLFGNNPREITFAARGGIMNTMKATQRVV